MLKSESGAGKYIVKIEAEPIGRWSDAPPLFSLKSLNWGSEVRRNTVVGKKQLTLYLAELESTTELGLRASSESD